MVDLGFIGQKLTRSLDFESSFIICYVELPGGHKIQSYPILFYSTRPTIEYQLPGKSFASKSLDPITASSSDKIKLSCYYPTKTESTYQWTHQENERPFQQMLHRGQVIEVTCESENTCSYRCSITFLQYAITLESSPLTITIISVPLRGWCFGKRSK